MVSNPSLEYQQQTASNQMYIGRGKKTRRAYGFDEIALAPGSTTIDPELCDITFSIGGHKLEMPIIASAMDSVVDPKMAIAMGKLGGLAVLNIQGLQTRYETTADVYKEVTTCDNNSFVEVMQKLYSAPVQEALITQRVKEMKAGGGIVAISITPNFAEKYGPIAVDAGCDIIFVQSTVTGIEHKSAMGTPNLNLTKYCQKIGVPVIVGNCVAYETALELLETGVAGILVGVGPGAACTSRSVLGIGVPMATSIADCAAARQDFSKDKNGPIIIADGGMVVGGDICKAIACGADAVMIGSPLARSKEAPGNGYHWGMATPSPVLPRGTRIKVGTSGSLQDILNGPAHIDDGTQNLTGALRTSMGTLGAGNLREMQEVEVVIAPSILTEGKVFQNAQNLGMGRS